MTFKPLSHASRRTSPGPASSCLFIALLLSASTLGAQVAPTGQEQAATPNAPSARLFGGGSYWLPGAVIGLSVGAGATFLVLHSGGSTAPCDRAKNQDAMEPRECLGLVAVGGVAGAVIGAVAGSFIPRAARHAEVRLVPGPHGLRREVLLRF